MAVTRGKGAGPGPKDLFDEAMEALLEAHPDLEPVDRDLDVGEGCIIDLACVDGGGQLWLVSWVREDVGDPILTVLDSMVWFEASRAVLARHFDCARLRPEAGLQVALLGQRFSERLHERLKGLDPGTLRLFELKRLSSARGTRAYVVPLETGRHHDARPEPATVDSFLEGLGEKSREMAQRMMHRLERIDDRLRCDAAAQRVTWHLPDGPLCELSGGNGRLVVRILPNGEQRVLGAVGDLEKSVEELLGVYVERLPTAAPQPKSPIDLALVDPAALLSPEEIEAFRQPG